jgi:hypothetical protein
MRLDFYVPLLFTHSETETLVAPPRELDGRIACEVKLAEHFGFELADLGIVGGTMELAIDEEPELRVSFWSPEPIDDATAERLIENVRVQMSDGAGEGGFDFEVAGEPLTALPIDDVDIRFVQFEDGVVVPPANAVAIAARKGDAVAVKQGLSRNPDDANRRFMNSPPLQWAIFGGSEDAVAALLDAGADPNEPNAWDSAPVLSCIFQGTLDDAKTARLLSLLAKAGADFSIKYGDMSLIECAENRKKTASIAVLRQVLGGKG